MCLRTEWRPQSGPAHSGRNTKELPRSTAVRSSADYSGGSALTGSVPLAAAGAATTLGGNSTVYPTSRRKQRNTLPSPDRDIDTARSRRDSFRSLHQESQISDRILRDYELEADDPKRAPESVLSSKDLRLLQGRSRIDSGMSGYNDTYTQTQYAATERPRSQGPAKSRYYDEDGDSDYDERSGRRYRGGNGRP